MICITAKFPRGRAMNFEFYIIESVMDCNVGVILAVLIKIANELSQVLRYPGILRYFWWITICSLLAPLLACQPGKRWRPLWCSRQIRPCVGRSALYGAKAYIETTFMRGIMFIFLSLIWSSCLLLFRTSWAWYSISLIYNLSHWDHTHTENLPDAFKMFHTSISRRVDIFLLQRVPFALQYLRTFLWFSNFVRACLQDHSSFLLYLL